MKKNSHSTIVFPIILLFLLRNLAFAQPITQEEQKEIATKNLIEEMNKYSGLKVGNSAKMKEYVLEGADVNAINKSGFTALFYCAGADFNDLATILIEKGAKINLKNADGLSPFFIAVIYNSFKIAQILIDNDAEINTTDRRGYTPLNYTTGNNSLESENKITMVKFLIKNGADINTKSSNGSTPLMNAAGIKPDINLIKLLLDNSAEVNATTISGHTALDFANRDEEIISLLQSYGGKYSKELK